MMDRNERDLRIDRLREEIDLWRRMWRMGTISGVVASVCIWTAIGEIRSLRRAA